MRTKSPTSTIRSCSPTVRDANSANSMQIAEVELIGVPVIDRPPVVLWVSFHTGDDDPDGDAAGAGFTEAPDKPYTQLLADAGYDVQRYLQTGTPDLDVVNAADLVIISRSVNSGSFSGGRRHPLEQRHRSDDLPEWLHRPEQPHGL